MTSYKKLKYLVRKLLKHEEIRKDSPDFEYQGITKDVYKDFITKLNQSKIIYSPYKGSNFIKEDLINENYFFDEDYKSSVLSSVIHLEDKLNKSKVISYIFNSVPKRIKFMLNNNFSNKFNDKLNLLLNKDERFCYFSQVIQLNSDHSKSICRILVEDASEHIDIVPLQYFIYESDWYICCYNLNINQLDIICSSNILKSKLLCKDTFCNYIGKKDIDDKIDLYAKNFYKDEEFLIKLNVATLNQIIESSLVTKFSVYEEREREFKTLNNKKYYADAIGFNKLNGIIYYDPKNNIITEKAISKIKKANAEREKIIKRRLYKIDLNTKLISEPNYYFSYEEEKFYEDKKYFVKIITSNKKFDLITKIFKIEVVDPNLYRI